MIAMIHLQSSSKLVETLCPKQLFLPFLKLIPQGYLKQVISTPTPHPHPYPMLYRWSGSLSVVGEGVGVRVCLFSPNIPLNK